MDVAKVDPDDIAYVAMAIHIYCKCLFQMFHLFFRRIFQVFYLDVAYVSHVCCKSFIHVFAMAFDTFQVFCKCFRHML
jgi:hypothetical protein